MLFSLLPLLVLSSVIAHNPARQQHHQHAKRRYEIDDRGLPITATTTIVVQKTLIETVWVQPTGQVPWDAGSPSATASSIPSESAIASSSEQLSSASELPSASSSAGDAFPSEPATSSEAPSATDSASPSETVSVTESSSPSGSASVSEVSSVPQAPSASPTESALPSESASPSITDSSSSAAESISSALASSTLSRSASRTNRPSAPASASSTVQSTEPASASNTESASAEPTPSASASYSSSGEAISRSTSRSNRNSAPPSSASSTFSAEPTSSSTSAEASSSISVEASSTSASSAAPSATHVAGTVRDGLLMNGYYPDWSAWKLAPENIDWSKFDVIDFAFAIPTAEFGLVFTQDDSASLLKRLVASAHGSGKLVKLSIGGWTGSVHFSDACSNSWNRQTFIGNIVDAYDAYGLDGIDIDWEYPGTGGAWGNVVTGADSANFLLFLQELREALPSGALITAATQVWPFAGPDGNPLKDVSAFAKVLDWILVMNYDIWGSSDNPGANAPLSDACGTSTQPLANAYASVSSWTTAGFPANQITLGVPAYGYLSKSSVTSLKNRRRSNLPQRPKAQRRGTVTIYNDNGGTSDGQVQFWNLISQGALAKDDSGAYVGAGGFERRWDKCSSTPWLRSSSSGQVITYDDPQSLSLKGQFAAQAGLRGCNVFSMDGDTSSWELVSAVRSGMGI